MTLPVKSIVAHKKKKPRTRRVKPKKDVKLDAKIAPADRDRFYAACQKRHVTYSETLRLLAIAYADAVEEGRSTDGRLEVRSAPSQK